jgi:hypothetical protein
MPSRRMTTIAPPASVLRRRDRTEAAVRGLGWAASGLAAVALAMAAVALLPELTAVVGGVRGSLEARLNDGASAPAARVAGCPP